MIKRITGFVTTVAIVALLVFVILHRERYTSLLESKSVAPQEVVVIETPDSNIAAPNPPDSIPSPTQDSIPSHAQDSLHVVEIVE